MSSIGFIWGIIILSRFGSNTGIYKIIKARIDIYESQEKNENKNSNLYFPNFFNLRIKKFRNIDENDDKHDKYNDIYDYNDLNSKDKQSYENILQLKPFDFKFNSYGLIRNLKDIEIGIAVILFIFYFLFLGVEIFYLIYSLGDKEFKVLPNKIFFTMNYISLISFLSSFLLLILSIAYAVLLIIANSEYYKLVKVKNDNCYTSILLDYIYGFYGAFHFIVFAHGIAMLKENSKLLVMS